MQIILNQLEIQQKITRLAHQIIENTFEQKTLFICGICGNGFQLAQKIKTIVEANSDQNIILIEMNVNKAEPWSEPIQLSVSLDSIINGYILLIDDVINSGKTMQYALVKLLEQATKAIKTVALVDRQHRRYPIKADFVGMSLSTTLKERVEVVFSEKESRAYLL
jgi:pyrimidine operon attenuation protein / uracil phosphoribosyltransferase